MIRHFVEFQGKPYGTFRGKIRITLNQKKVFVLNRVAVEALKNPSFVKLYFDAQRSIIGMRRVEGNHPNAFPVKGARPSATK